MNKAFVIFFKIPKDAGKNKLIPVLQQKNLTLFTPKLFCVGKSQKLSSSTSYRIYLGLDSYPRKNNNTPCCKISMASTSNCLDWDNHLPSYPKKTDWHSTQKRF